MPEVLQPQAEQPHIAVLGKEGDTKIFWDRRNADEVDNARKSFTDLRKKGFAAFAMDRDDKKGKQINEFDLNAERILMVPPLQGG